MVGLPSYFTSKGRLNKIGLDFVCGIWPQGISDEINILIVPRFRTFSTEEYKYSFSSAIIRIARH